MTNAAAKERHLRWMSLAWIPNSRLIVWMRISLPGFPGAGNANHKAEPASRELALETIWRRTGEELRIPMPHCYARFYRRDEYADLDHHHYNRRHCYWRG